MWLSRELIEEKLLNAEFCSIADFRDRNTRRNWSVKSHRISLEGILASFGIENDNQKNNLKGLARLLNTKPDPTKPKTLGRDIGSKKRKKAEMSMAESSDEEGFGPSQMNLSSSTVLSLDEDSQVLELKRQLCEAKKEIKGS